MSEGHQTGGVLPSSPVPDRIPERLPQPIRTRLGTIVELQIQRRRNLSDPLVHLYGEGECGGFVKAVYERASSEEHILSELYERHALGGFRFAYLLMGKREVAEDLLQEAFLRVYERFEGLRSHDAIPAYLRTTILNLARAQFRKGRAELRSLRRQALLEARLHTEPPELGLRDRLWRALQSLPYRQRAALVLRFYEDLSERDAAEALGTTTAGIKALVSRGTRSLREVLDPMEGGED
jgi:RNA polymerase sigma factor (sigma-70 family)